MQHWLSCARSQLCVCDISITVPSSGGRRDAELMVSVPDGLGCLPETSLQRPLPPLSLTLTVMRRHNGKYIALCSRAQVEDLIDVDYDDKMINFDAQWRSIPTDLKDLDARQFFHAASIADPEWADEDDGEESPFMSLAALTIVTNLQDLLRPCVCGMHLQSRVVATFIVVCPSDRSLMRISRHDFKQKTIQKTLPCWWTPVGCRLIACICSSSHCSQTIQKTLPCRCAVV